MKKLSVIILVALTTLTISTAAFAGNKEIPRFIGVENFVKTFPHATMITCQQIGQFTKVNFLWDNMKLQAFFDQDGNLFGTSREIAVNDLPLSVRQTLQKKYEGFLVTEAIEFDQTDSGMNYYITVAAPEKCYVLQVLSDGTISVFKKMKY
jgi:hypothetical protein